MSAHGGPSANWPGAGPGPAEPGSGGPDPVVDAGARTAAPVLDPAPVDTSTPRGPGVVPPFAAPPTDGIRKRMWLGLTAGAIALIVLCVGGLGGCIALGVTAVQARSNAATKVVTDFLTAWEHNDFAAAYQLTCDDVRKQESLADFTGELSARQLSDFTVGDPDLSTSVALVPVRLEFAEGGFDTERYRVVVDKSNKSQVCGTA
jgi:hypothetical protein